MVISTKYEWELIHKTSNKGNTRNAVERKTKKDRNFTVFTNL